MTCPKCSGAMRMDHDIHDPGPFCLYCGYRPREAPQALQLEPWVDVRVPGHHVFSEDERRRAHTARQQRYRAAKRNGPVTTRRLEGATT